VSKIYYWPKSAFSSIIVGELFLRWQGKQRERGWGWGRKTNYTRFTAVIHVHQITVQVHVLISANLHRCIRGLFRLGAGWEVEFCVESIGREADQGDGLRGEFVWVRGDEDPLDGWVGRLSPVGF
jgi:hypothetical protein